MSDRQPPWLFFFFLCYKFISSLLDFWYSLNHIYDAVHNFRISASEQNSQKITFPVQISSMIRIRLKPEEAKDNQCLQRVQNVFKCWKFRVHPNHEGVWLRAEQLLFYIPVQIAFLSHFTVLIHWSVVQTPLLLFLYIYTKLCATSF